MELLLNLVFAFLFGWLALWLAKRATAPEPLAWIIAVVVAILVFAFNLAGRLLSEV